MRVLVGPRLEPGSEALTATVAKALAGPDGEVVWLQQAGVKDLSRRLTQAEVARLRAALAGDAGAEHAGPGVVGYVCKGVALAGAAPQGAARGRAVGGDAGRTPVVAVTDHVNLTWRSPLVGPNDDLRGPRFPSMTGIYEPAVVLERVSAEGCIIVKQGVVAGVGDDELLDAYESETVSADHHLAVSSELVPVSIVAAHMGLRIAAAVMTTVGSSEEEMGSGRF